MKPKLIAKFVVPLSAAALLSGCGGGGGGGGNTVDPYAYLKGVFLNPIMERRWTNAIALGDVDGDGDLDLVDGTGDWDSVNAMPTGSANLVYLNDGTGNYSNSGQEQGNSYTRSVDLGDVDGDGDLDLLEGVYEWDAVNRAFIGAPSRLYFNDGSGNYSDSGQFIGSSSTRAMALGDVDGDGDLDLVEGASDVDWVNQLPIGVPNRVYLNDGSGNYSDSGQTLGSSFTTSVALGDVDGDGDLDLVEVGSDGVASSRVYLNDGDGNYSDSGLVQVLGNNWHTIALGDVDGDGDLDMVEGGFDWDEVNQVIIDLPKHVYLNDGSGAYSDSGQAFGNSSAKSLTLDDVDGDGDLDLVDINVNGQANSVYLNDGTGHYSDSGQALGDGRFINSLALGDVDGDGDHDLVDGSPNNLNHIYINNGLGYFTDGSQALGNSDTRSVALGDVDDDGDLDLVAGNTGTPGLIYLNDGLGNYSDSGQTLSLSYWTFSVALGDVDGDRDLDLVTADGTGGGNRIYLNDGLGTFTNSGEYLGSSNTYSVAFGDVDGDGDLDLVSGNYSTQPNRIYLNDGTGHYTDSGQALGSAWTASIALGDVDGDGDLDLVAGNDGALQSRIYLNDGHGTFTDSGQALGLYSTWSVTLGDVDGDGDLDLVAGAESYVNSPTLIYLNDGAGNFTDSGQTLGSYITWSVALADVDGDGDLDLVEGNGGSGNSHANRVYLNDGAGNFIDSGRVLGSNRTQSIALGDVDRDGDLDLVEGNYSDANRVYLNLSY